MVLQWGRALGARKTAGVASSGGSARGFNGAALWGRGKRSSNIEWTDATWLQWGRALGARKTRTHLSLMRLESCFNGAALWGRGKRRRRPCRRCVRSPRFNGAALWGRGKPRHHVKHGGRTEASMGPRFGGAENNLWRVLFARLIPASMGPRFGGAENAFWDDVLKLDVIASMGPRFGGAENGCLAHPGRCRRCFNGAALWGRGKPPAL